MEDDLLFHNKFVSDLKVPNTYNIKNKNKEAAFRQYIDKKKNIVGLNDEDTDIFEEHVMTTNPLVVSKDGTLNKERHIIERRYIYNINSKTRQITKEDYVEKEVVTGEYVKVTTNNFGEVIYETVDVDELNVDYNALDIPNSVVNPFFMVGENMYFKSFLYRTPDEYIIDLPLMHTNVKSVRLLSSVIPCTTTNINRYNNHVMIDILFGSTQVLENQDFDVVFGTYLMKIPYGNYTIDEVCSKITSLANAFYYENYTNNTGINLYDKVNMLSTSSFKYNYSPITGELYFSLDQPSNLETIETLNIVEPIVYENTIMYDPTGLNSNYNSVQIPIKEYTDFVYYIRTLVAAMNYDFCGYVLNSYINEFIVIEKENKRYLCSLFEEFNLDMGADYVNIRNSLSLASGINSSTSTAEGYIVDITAGYNAFPSYDATTSSREIKFTVGSNQYSNDITSMIYTTKESFFNAILDAMNSKYTSNNFSLHTHTLNNGTTGYSIKSNVEYTFTTMDAALSATIFGTSGTDIVSAYYGLYVIDITAGYNAFVNYNSTLANDIFFTVANTTYEPSIGNVFFTNYTAFINAIVDAMNDDTKGYPLGNFTFSTQQQLKFNNSTYNYELENRYYIMSDVYFNFECSTMDPLISSPLFGSVTIETTNEILYYVDIAPGYNAFSGYDATTNSTEILFTVAGTSYTGNIDENDYTTEDEFFAAVASAMNAAYPDGNFAFLKNSTVEYRITSSVEYTFNVMESALSTAIFGTAQTNDIPSVTYSFYMNDITAGYESFSRYDASLVSDKIVFKYSGTEVTALIDNIVYTSFEAFMQEIVGKMNAVQLSHVFSFIVSRNGTTTKYYLASSGDFSIKVNPSDTDIRLSTKIFGVIPTSDFNSTVHALEVTQPNSEFLYKPTATTEIHFNFNSTDFIAYIPSVNYPDYDTFITAVVNAMNVTCKTGFFAFDREGSEGYYRYTLYSAGETTLKFSDMPAIGTVMVHPPTDSDITEMNQIDLTGGYNAFIMPYDAYASDFSKLYLNIRQKVPDPPFEDDPAITNVTVQVSLLNGVAATYKDIEDLMTHIISRINITVTGASWLKPDTSLTFGYSINTASNIITIFCESTPSDVYEFNLDGSLMVALASFLGIAITTPTTYTTSYVSPYNYGNRLRFKMSFENNPDVSQDDQMWYMLGFRSNNSLMYLDTPWTNLFDYGNDSYYFSSTSFVNNFVPNRSTEMLPDIEDKRPYRLPSMSKTNYVYLQLNNYENMYDPSIPNEKIYTKILLSENYGKFSYDTFVDNPYVLSTTDSRLDRLQIKFIDKNANPVDFNNIDHTLTIEIVEYSDRLSANDYNTRRGYNEHSSYPDALRLGYGK